MNTRQSAPTDSLSEQTDPPEDALDLPEDPEPPEDDDLPEDDPETPPDPDEPEPEPASNRQRGSARVQSLVNENRQLRERQTEFERQLRELTQARREPSPAERAAAEAVERERFEMLSTWEQKQYLESRLNGQVESRVNDIARGLWDQNDRTQYDSLWSQHPQLSKLTARQRDALDKKVEELRAQAPAVSRRILLATAIGMNTLDRAPAAATRAGNRAQGERERQRANPSNSRADVPHTERGRSGGSLEDRLRDQSI